MFACMRICVLMSVCTHVEPVEVGGAVANVGPLTIVEVVFACVYVRRTLQRTALCAYICACLRARVCVYRRT